MTRHMTLPRVSYERKNPLIRIIFKFEFNSINRVISYEYTLNKKKKKPSVVTECLKSKEIKLRCEGNLLFRKHLNPSETSSKTSRVTLKMHDKFREIIIKFNNKVKVGISVYLAKV